MNSLTSTLFGTLHAIVALAVVLGSDHCAAGIIRHDRNEEDYRKLGLAEEFRCVVKVGIKPLGLPVKFGGSAVLITPRWVLTAGHVGRTVPVKKLRFQFGDEEFRAIRRVPHPDFAAEWKNSGMGVVSGGDLALVQLDRPVPNIRPAMRYHGEDEVGRTLTKVGYGVAGDGKNGLKRAGTPVRSGSNNVIDAAGAKLGKVEVNTRVLLFDFDDPDKPSSNQLGDASPLDLEGGVSIGDSGGGWFIKDDGKWKLVAITSRRIPSSGDLNDDQSQADLYYGAIGLGIRVSTANNWIDEVIGD